jgi:hypothetical protein
MILAVIVESVRTRKDRTLAVTVGTQEVTPSQAGELFEMQGKLCACYITEKESVPQEVIDAVDETDFDRPGKTQSQRLRGVIFKLWQQDAEGFKTFDEYYHAKTDKIIEHLKTKIK